MSQSECSQGDEVRVLSTTNSWAGRGVDCRRTGKIRGGRNARQRRGLWIKPIKGGAHHQYLAIPVRVGPELGNGPGSRQGLNLSKKQKQIDY